MMLKNSIISKYNLIGLGIVAAVFPALFFISFFSIIFFNDDITIEDIDNIIQSYELPLSASSIYVLLIILWLLNKRFNLRSLNWVIIILLILGLVDFVSPFVFDSSDTVNKISNYTLVFWGLFFILFGVKLYKSSISFYGLRSSYSIISILMGIFSILSGYYIITDIEMEINFGLMSILFVFLMVIIRTIFNVLLLYRAYKDKVIGGII